MKTPKEISRLWFTEIWNKRQSEGIRAFMADHAIGHLEGGVDITGPDEFIAFQKSILDAIPDLHVDVLNTLADGDDCCVLWNATGTHSGEGMGFQPSGRSVSFRGVTWFHFEDGKVVEGWDCWNQGGLMQVLVAGQPLGN